MKKKVNIFTIGLAIAVCCGQCKDKYVSPYKVPDVGYLVVEGFISGNLPIQYTLSRTLPLPGDTTIPKETGANVQVEGNDNSVFPLIQQRPGIYTTADTPFLDPQANYRLRIHTANGEDYLSDYVPFKPSPAIDSINWIHGPTGVTIYANTHDPANATRYYEWDYQETWEYHSAEESHYQYDTATGKIVARPASSQIYSCWHSDSSTRILLGTSIKLAQDVIYEQPLNVLPTNGWQLGVLYTTQVRQWALTDSAYGYMSILQKNTESLGSIFDVQPSQLAGNIHCITKPAEQVIGWVSAGTIRQARIWIYPSEVPGWIYHYFCADPDTVVSFTNYGGQKYFFLVRGMLPVDLCCSGGGVFINSAYCVDCRTQGGTLYPPAIWQPPVALPPPPP